MALVGVNVRRTIGLLLSVVLLFGATTVIASHSADAAYPGGNEWIVFMDGDAPSHIWAIRSDGSDLTKLTDTLNFDSDPAFSADGTKVAFARSESNVSSIYVADFLNGDTASPSLGTPLQVSNGPIDGSPSFSPDGTQVVYHSREVTVISTGSATADNPAGTLLTDTAADFVTDGVISGDTVRNTTDGSSAIVTGRTANTVAMSGGLANGSDDEWAEFDNYSIERRFRQIRVSPTDGSSLPGTLLSPSGSELLYSDAEPVWSPNGQQIAFTSTQIAANSDIYVMDANGSNRTNLTTAGTLDNDPSHPAWAPDGGRIAFQTAEEAGEPSAPSQNIWTITAAGTSPVMVTSSDDEEVEPAWSPDGSLIAFRNFDQGNKLYVIASDGTGLAARVGSAATPADNQKPDWQPVLAGVADADSVDEGGTVNVDVLANDLVLATAAAGGVADTSATLVTEPTRGTATRQGDGSFTYEHTGPEIGSSAVTDTFVYTVTQGSFSSTALVTITVNPVDNDPVAVADEYFVDHGATLNVAAPGVLDNDSDPEGEGLSATPVGDVSNGTLSLAANGSFVYTHDGVGTAAVTDTFTYTASDGANDSAVTTVTINVGAENPDPPSVAIEGPSFGAPGEEVSFGSTVTDGSGPKTYAWSISQNGTEITTGVLTTIDFTPTTTGAFTVELTVSDSAGSDTDTVDFTVMTDIAGNTFVADIVWLANEGITKGCNPPANDEYCPNDRVTRGQMAAFLVRFLGLTDGAGADLFTDDDGSLFETNIDKLATAGITRGCNPPTNDNFCPNDFVTRGQMAAFIVRALSLTDGAGDDLFTDDDGTVFENNIDILATAGITRGCNPPTNDLFCPNDFVTRGQMAAFLHRADALK